MRQTTQAQPPGPRDATIAPAALKLGSLPFGKLRALSLLQRQRMVRPNGHDSSYSLTTIGHHSCSDCARSTNERVSWSKKITSDALRERSRQ